MGVYLNDKELHALEGMPHEAITLYVMAVRTRMNYATGIVGQSPRISWRALMEWCHIEPDAHGGGGARPVQLTMSKVRRLVARLERAGALTKETVHDKDNGREYVQLCCPLASLKDSPRSAVLTGQAPPARTAPTDPPKSAALPQRTHAGLPPATLGKHCQRSAAIASSRRGTAISCRQSRRNPVDLAAKKTDSTALDTCVKNAPDRGSDIAKPALHKGLQPAPDRAPDIHQRSKRSIKPLPPTPFVSVVADSAASAPTNADNSVSSGDSAMPKPPTTEEQFTMAPHPEPETGDSNQRVALIWPICIHESQKLPLLQHLASSTQPQAILDELAGAHHAGMIRSSPVGYLMGLLRREREGGFIPERGIAILQTREAFRRHEARKSKHPSLSRPPTQVAQTGESESHGIPPESRLGQLMAKLPGGGGRGQRIED